MRSFVFEPWRIRIGKNTIVNEFCTLDGRGTLIIGDNVSISMHTIIYSASHDLNSNTFDYYERKTVIGNGVWIGARAIILAGTIANDLCVFGAGSVVTPKEYEEKGIYAGVPAKKIKERDISYLNISKNRTFFR